MQLPPAYSVETMKYCTQHILFIKNMNNQVKKTKLMKNCSLIWKCNFFLFFEGFLVFHTDTVHFKCHFTTFSSVEEQQWTCTGCSTLLLSSYFSMEELSPWNHPISCGNLQRDMSEPMLFCMSNVILRSARPKNGEEIIQHILTCTIFHTVMVKKVDEFVKYWFY